MRRFTYGFVRCQSIWQRTSATSDSSNRHDHPPSLPLQTIQPCWMVLIGSVRRSSALPCLESAMKEPMMRDENSMGCLLLILFLAFPRIALVWLFLFSNYLQRAYHGLILPLLGFLLLPLTTLVYAWMANTRQPITGINLLILVVTVVIDLGGLGGGEYHRRRRWND